MKYNRYALTLVCSLLMFCFSNRSSAQITLSADPTTCGDTAVTLHAVLLGDVPTSSGITSDDGYSAAINIGFTFNFYGNNYTQLVIGSNGMLTMGTTLAGAYCPWPISAALLGNASARNSICGPWSDICTPCATPGGTITYSTIGTAPYRKFMATWCRTRMFGCTAQWETFQIIIYETTNICETHIAHRTTGCTWNGGYAIVGVQNATGTAATAAPGRDFPSLWGAINEAWRFTPSGAPISSYTCTSIPFAPVPYSSSTIYWYDSATHVLVGTGPTINVSPSVPTTYMATAAGCDDSTFAFIHVNPPGSVGGGISAPVHITNLVYPDTIECGSNTGYIKIYGVNPGFADSIFYSYNGVPQPTIVQTSLADSSLTISGLSAGVYDYVYVKQGTCPSNALSAVINNSVLVANFSFTTALGCLADTVFINSSSFNHGVPTPPGPTGTYTSVYSFGDGTIDSSFNPVHAYTTQGTYNINLLYHNNYGCSDVMTLPVTFNHTVTSVFSPSASVVCLGVPVSFTNTSVGGGATYSWTFGDGGASTLANPTYAYIAPGSYVVTLTVQDTIGCQAVSNTTIDVQSITTHTEVHDTTVCLKMPMPMHTFTEVVASTPTSVSYLWTPGTNLSDPTVSDPDFLVGVGDFTYTFTATLNPLGCTASDVVTVHSMPPITLTHVTASTTIPYGSSIQLNADSAWIYVWSPNDGSLTNPNINNPIATPTDSVNNYMVIGMSPYGCRDTAYVTIRVADGSSEFIPEAFTPNGDGLNDVFRVFNMRYQKLVDFRIFNRWGREVFHTIDPKTGWDGTYNGTPQDMGTYYYQIIVARPDGEQKTYNGNVTLIR